MSPAERLEAFVEAQRQRRTLRLRWIVGGLAAAVFVAQLFAVLVVGVMGLFGPSPALITVLVSIGLVVGGSLGIAALFPLVLVGARRRGGLRPLVDVDAPAVLPPEVRQVPPGRRVLVVLVVGSYFAWLIALEGSNVGLLVYFAVVFGVLLVRRLGAWWAFSPLASGDVDTTEARLQGLGVAAGPGERCVVWLARGETARVAQVTEWMLTSARAGIDEAFWVLHGLMLRHEGRDDERRALGLRVLAKLPESVTGLLLCADWDDAEGVDLGLVDAAVDARARELSAVPLAFLLAVQAHARLAAGDLHGARRALDRYRRAPSAGFLTFECRRLCTPVERALGS